MASPPRIKRFPLAKQRRMDELLDKNTNGLISDRERERLGVLVREAEALMAENAKRLGDFANEQSAAPPSHAVPVTVWVIPDVVADAAES